MKILTGIEPIVDKIRVPAGVNRFTFQESEEFATVPLATLTEAREAWLIHFGPKGRIGTPTTIAWSEPSIRRFQAKAPIAAERGPEFKDREIARLIEIYRGPDDTRVVEDRLSFLGADIIEVSISYWEVTL